MDFMAALTPGPCLFLSPVWGIPGAFPTACSTFSCRRCGSSSVLLWLLCVPSSVPVAVPLQVAGLFHHASIGNPINIAIVRLILLEHEEVREAEPCQPCWAGLQNPAGLSWVCVGQSQVPRFAPLPWLVEPGALWAEEQQSLGFGWFVGSRWQCGGTGLWGTGWPCPGCRGGSGGPEVSTATSFTLSQHRGSSCSSSPLLLDDFMFWLNHR